MRNETKNHPAEAQAERRGAERAWWLAHLPAALCLGAAVIVFLLSSFF
jgi:hypothetical protein